LLQPLVEAIRRHVMDAAKIHADDTPVPVLSPGNGKTKTGRLWTYVRDDRPHGAITPPAAFRPTGKAFIRKRIWLHSKEFCKPMPMLGSTPFTTAGECSRRLNIDPPRRLKFDPGTGAAI
jgi:Transposase IS66 family